MARKKSPTVRCPTCKAAVKKNGPEFPFCSERCRTIDLGKWPSGAYVVSSPLRDGDEAGESILRNSDEDS
jgi:uncharacterized protein